jgi:hypothetical protein
MAAGNLPQRTDREPTSEYFNNFFEQEFVTSQNVNDAVVGYFQSITGDAASAKVLASTVLMTALSQGIDPVSIIDELRRLSQKNRAAAPAETSYTSRVSQATDPYANPGPPSRKNFNEIDAYLTVFLNLNRVGSSLLGISNQPQTNKYVQRAILP